MPIFQLRNLRPVLEPEGQEFVLAHYGRFYSRVPKIRVKLDKDVSAPPQLVQPAADFFLFLWREATVSVV